MEQIGTIGNLEISFFLFRDVRTKFSYILIQINESLKSLSIC